MVLHYGPNLSPKNTWILFNEIYDGSDCGIQIGGSVTDPVYIIGNVIRNISNPDGAAYAIRSWTRSDIYLVNNTLYGNDGGISITGGGGRHRKFGLRRLCGVLWSVDQP